MTLNPQQIRETRFKPSKRGFDQDEVSAFQRAVADALESAQNDATAMEARARAAVARLQELSASGGAHGPDDAGDAPVSVRHSVDEAETISRTLLLAQRTADTTIADAETEAERVLGAARAEAASQLDAARTEVDMLIEAGRTEARRAGEADKVRVEGEVQALLARRDFLESDVEHLEQFIMAQRERLTEAAGQLGDMVQRIPGGLADMRRPLLSAADERDDPAVAADEVDPTDEGSEIAEITRVAAADDAGGEDATGDVWAMRTDDLVDDTDDDDDAEVDEDDELADDYDDEDGDEDEDEGDDRTPADSSLFDEIDRPR